MRKNIVKLGAGFAAISALALGGSALASAGPKAAPAAPPAVAAPVIASHDTEVKGSGSAADADTLQDTTSPDSAAGTAGSESSSEVAGNDGPGGHADEPGNPGVDHQAVGNE